MNEDDVHAHERQSLQTRLLDAVKQCQVRFGGRTELATDSDARVSCLCSGWESVLQHGLKGDTKPHAALRQVREITGLTKVAGIFTEKSSDKELAFWGYIKAILTHHEAERFMNLKNVSTNSGRGRSWFRASLNEHSLERYMHMLVESDSLLSQFYESWAFLRDQEKGSMLPMMARGLDSILFAITIDNANLNTIRQAPNMLFHIPSTTILKQEEEPQPVIAGQIEIDRNKKKEKKKKKITHIVSFDENISGSGTFSRINHSVDKESFKFGSPTDDFLISPDCLDVLSKEPNEFNSKILVKSDNSAFSLTNGQFLSFPQTNESTDVLQTCQSQTMLQTGQLSDSRESNHSGIGVINKLNQDPVVVSDMSEARQSPGSFSSTDFELSMEMSGNVTMTPITPGGCNALDDNDVEAVLGHSYDSSNLSMYSNDDIQSATFALKQAQNSLHQRIQGDGGNSSEDINCSTMSVEELKKAVVSMMLRKDEVEELNRSLNQMLDREMETSSLLRAEIEELKHAAAVRQEKEQTKVQTMQKENELLKHQLRKYVNAVQMLRTEGTNIDVNLGIHVDDPQPGIPPEKPKMDYVHEAEEYEKKLIQVAEMHGELMEFNELLHHQLNRREHLLKRLQDELIDLRGPLPHDISFTENSLVLETRSLSVSQTRLINVWIPSAFLQGSASDSHHVYQVYIRIRDEEWNVYKRYKQFFDLQKEMKKKYPLTAQFEFPPKKSFGKKDTKVVESRRLVLQSFLRTLINHVIEKDTTLSSYACRQTLLEVLPFFSDKTSDKDKKKNKKSNQDGQRSPLSASPLQTASAPAQYSGL